MLERSDAARVQEAPAHGLRDAAHVVEVRALEPAVAVHVRVDEGRDSTVAQPPDRVAGGHLGRLGPARGRDMAAADVDGDEDARPEGADHRIEEVDVAERRRADDDPLRPRAQRLAHRGEAAKAAPVLDGYAGLARDAAQV